MSSGDKLVVHIPSEDLYIDFGAISSMWAHVTDDGNFWRITINGEMRFEVSLNDGTKLLVLYKRWLGKRYINLYTWMPEDPDV